MSDANQANFDEVEGHLKILNARLRTMMPDDGAQSKLLEDYEDYYDRSIGLRVMENNTLKVENDEHKQHIATISAKETTRSWLLWLITTVAALLASEVVFPGMVVSSVAGSSITATDVASHALVAAVAWKVSCKIS